MDKVLLGKILASVVLGATAAGEIVLDTQGHPQDPKQLGDIIQGFITVWMGQQAGK